MPFAIFMLMVFLSIDNNFITTAAIAAYRRVYVFYDLQRLFGKVFPHFVIGSRNNFFFAAGILQSFDIGSNGSVSVQFAKLIHFICARIIALITVWNM